jgi:hypothetical protein
MDDVETKFLVIEVEGEAVLKFPIHSIGNERFEMMYAVLASNPVLRLVNNAEVGKTWNGVEYA